MALEIGDSDLSVDLEAAGLHPEPGGWPQAGPVELPDGRFADVEETIKLAWHGADDDAGRWPTLRDLGLLGRRARQVDRRRRIAYVPTANQVTLTAQTPTESAARYALIRSLDVPKLDGRHQGRATAVDLQLRLRREGLWRGVHPNSPPLQVLASTPIDNHTTNYVTIPPGAIAGDAPALAKVTIEINNRPRIQYTGSGGRTKGPRLMVARATAANEADLDAIPNFLWAATAARQGAGTLVDPSTVNANLPAVPGNQVLYGAGFGNGWLEWELGDLSLFNGAYHFYVIHYTPGAPIWPSAEPGNNVWLLRTGRYNSAIYQEKQPEMIVSAPLSQSPTWTTTYGGLFNVPPGGLHLAGAQAPTIRAEWIYYSDTGIGNVTLAGVMLVPAVDQVMAGRVNYFADTVIFDGPQSKSYTTTAGSLIDANADHDGPYITLEPGLYNRLFVFDSGDHGTFGAYPYDNSPANHDYYWDPAMGYNVQVAIVPRYRFLRGS